MTFEIIDRYMTLPLPVSPANDNSSSVIMHNIGIMAEALFQSVRLLPIDEAARVLCVISEEIALHIKERLT